MKNYLLFSLLLSSFSLFGYDRITGLDFASRSEVLASNGMAATSHPLATQTAISVLKNGGNAIDAAIAANAVLGLVEPTGCGIGGDLFAIVWSADDKKLYGLNSSGPAPINISIEEITSKGLDAIPPYGPLPVTVPGAVAGWVELHKRFGIMDFNLLFQNAIEYAEKGFPVTEVVAYYLKLSSENFIDYPNFKKTWMPNGKIPSKGEIFKNPYLARTYKKIAQSYGEDFYKGNLAKEIVSFINNQGGYFSLEDLSEFKPEWIDPVSTNYRGYDVWELPPNGQGIAALQMLNILENYNIKDLGFGSAEYIHLFTEAKKIAYEDRALYYADPNFSDIPLKTLISKEYAKERLKLIDLTKSSKSYNAGLLEEGDTIYLTVADKYGNMVSLIQSNYRGMGSGMVPNDLGFMLQDRGEMFSLDPNHMNSLIGGKRPFHTIIPAFITKNNKPLVSFGLMGGAMQPQGHAQIVINLIDFKMNLQEAGDAPRIRHAGSSQPTGEKMTDGGYLSLEKGISAEEILKLEKLGHKFQYDLGGFGGYQAIMLKDNVYIGASESRKDGHASGY
ncbi:MAG: gamma-glutamyltransferase [SAR86 cluster bacterium]|uniref:Glutathione hydrolase proenzyme n=1 Tax=SAR86 cluster bacterium TaxID=2030880 RepID=A0A520N6Z4_9GAMM|nr:MAG: gamma-glutamyltransferase [SAR86 cluster bacterium]|tara:strand:+ start:360 stop:2039 length:1680 start_codon:yes stop_codon:yes gene_type:complete